MFTQQNPFSYDNLKTAIAQNVTVDKKQLEVALRDAKDLQEITDLLKENGAQKLKLLYAEYLLAKAADSLASQNDQLKYGLYLIDLIQSTTKNEDIWQSFSKQEKYQNLIRDLLSYRSLKEPENETALHSILAEGIRCKNIVAFENVIRYAYTKEHGYNDGAESARKLCYQLALALPLDKKDTFSNEVYPILIELNKPSNKNNKEINFIKCLSHMCRKEYFISVGNPLDHADVFNSLIANYGLELVSEIVQHLNYGRLKCLLAMYHAKEAIANYNSKSPDYKIYSKHIDTAEQCFTDLKGRGLFVNFIDKFLDGNKPYSDVLFALSCSRRIDDNTRASYLLKGTEYNHAECVESLIKNYISQGNIDDALIKFDQHIRKMRWDELLKLTSNLLKYKAISDSKELKEKALHIRDVILAAREHEKNLLPELTFEQITKMIGEKEMVLNDQLLHVSSNQTVFMVAVKNDANKINIKKNLNVIMTLINFISHLIQRRAKIILNAGEY